MMATSVDACPACGAGGRRISSTTISAMLKPSAAAEYSGEEMRFCRSASCSVVYFGATSSLVYETEHVRVPVFQKGDDPDRLVCYCFGHSVSAVQADAVAQGRSTIFETISARCRAGDDDCQRTNPQGSCCLGNVRRVAKTPGEAGDAGASGCCDTNRPALDDAEGSAPSDTARPVQRVSAAGALLAAVLASACCWLPLMLVGVGTSAAGLAGLSEALRPYLLIATAMLLGTGFFLAYRPQRTCVDDEECRSPRPERTSRLGLWLVAVVALVSVFLPDIMGAAVADTPIETTVPESADVRTYQVTGMTCAGCAIHVREAIEAIDAVKSARVVYEAATVTVALRTSIDDGQIMAAIASLGYVGKRVESEPLSASGGSDDR